MTDEKHDLDNLLKHPGWQRYEKQAKTEIEARLQTALVNAANNTNDALAINIVRQCVAVKQAIEALLEWPDARLKTLEASVTRSEKTGQMSRRGTL